MEVEAGTPKRFETRRASPMKKRMPTLATRVK